MRLASCISFGIIVTLFAWIAHKLQSSNKCTKKSSEDSCNANNASAVHRIGWSVNSLQISLTSLAKGSFRINKSVDFWYFLISRMARVPGLYLRFCWIGGPICSGHVRIDREREINSSANAFALADWEREKREDERKKRKGVKIQKKKRKIWISPNAFARTVIKKSSDQSRERSPGRNLERDRER